MQKILQLRRNLAKYQEWFYMPFVMAMGGLMSFGMSSEDKIYLILFAVTTLLLGIKLIITDYNFRELLIICIFGIWLAINFLYNHEKTLIVTYLALIGIKNIDIYKVLKYSLWSRVGITVIRISLALIGIIPNYAESKWRRRQVIIYFFGYPTANAAFANILMIVFLFVLVYSKKIKWYGYIGLSIFLLGAYHFTYCRSGMVVWLLFCVMLFLAWLFKIIGFEKIYLGLYITVPIFLTSLTFFVTYLGKTNAQFMSYVYHLMPNRLEKMVMYVYDMNTHIPLFTGCYPREPFDNGIYNLAYNYGWVMLGVWLLAYSLTIWYSIRNNNRYEVLVLAVMAIYGFMELFPISVLWNFPLLFIARLLFKGENKDNEHV